MGAQSTEIIYEQLKSISATTFNGTYQPLGVASTHPARIFKIINASTVPITLSVDGVNDYDYLPENSFVLYDMGTNRGNPASETCLPPTQFYVKSSVGAGAVYAVILYANTPNTQVPL